MRKKTAQKFASPERETGKTQYGAFSFSFKQKKETNKAKKTEALHF